MRPANKMKLLSGPVLQLTVIYLFMLLSNKQIETTIAEDTVVNSPSANDNILTKSLDSFSKLSQIEMARQGSVNDSTDSSSEDSTEDRTYDYLDYNDAISSISKKKTISSRESGIVYTWGKWQKWGKCSRTCGGGVQTKVRLCVEKFSSATEARTNTFIPSIHGRMGCKGILKKYRICNIKKCQSDKEFRDIQCSAFDKIPFKGKLYNWEGYIKDHHECELNCKPIDLDHYISLNKTVTDGTPCVKPAVYYTHSYRRKAVCVEGICRAVHSSGAIRSATTNDSRQKCGSVLCHVVSEMFSKSKLPFGYTYVALIGAGAMNLTAKQMAKSENLLALKSIDDRFIINGNNRLSNSGDFEYNGDVFVYDRDRETITARGPLVQSVVLLLLVNGINPGVKYDYTLPVPSAAISEDEETETQWNELGVPLDDVEDNTILDGSITTLSSRPRDRKRRKFSWKLLGFGQCNRSCGPGVRSPIFRCIRDSPTRFYSPRRCAFAEKPVFHEDIYKCNVQLCPAYWRPDEFSDCKCNTEGKGKRHRTLKCIQEQASGRVEPVDEAHCLQDSTLELTEECDCPKQTRRKIFADRSNKSDRIYSRLIGSAPSVYNAFNQTASLRRGYRDNRNDKTGVWLMSNRTGGCSADCDIGFEHRSVYCDRTAPYTDLCDIRITPEMKRPCVTTNHQCKKGVWFTSTWSNCTGDCFNLARKRTVLCVKGDVIVSDVECNAADRPVDKTNCTHKDVSFCGPKWHYSEWSQCSRSCGEGIQRRYAKCLEFDWKQNTLQESKNCKYLDREPVYGTCNLQKCEELESTVDDLQNDLITPVKDCTDEFSNCKRINRSRLCKLQYYKTYCCLTCNGY